MGTGKSNDRIRVLFFDEAVAFGGSVVVLAHLFDHIDRTRFQPLLVTSLDEGSIRKLFRPEDVLCWYQPRLDYSDRMRWMTRCPSRLGLIRRLWAYAFTVAATLLNLPRHVRLFYRVWKSGPAIVHINNGHEGLAAVRLFRFPMIIHLHGISHDFLFGPFDTRVHTRAFVSISKYITSQAIKYGVPPQRILDIPNPAPVPAPSSVSDDAWRERFKLPPDAVVFAHVGRLIRWKGQLEFLEAFAKMAPDCPHAYALIVGDDVEGFSTQYPQSLRDLVQHEGLTGRAVFAGHIDNILELMEFADVVVHSSIDPEPFGLVITEAMSAGAAVIAARLGAPIELIDQGVTGMLVDPKDVTEFAAALRELATDAPRRKQLALAGQLVAREKYSPQSFARQMEAVYEKVARDVAGGERAP
ncbi:MAG TPA: glycosyltransferase family 4 protein [Steroidobacteraceae bacterium]|jgi:glycosyltransferase involved in cell wall biosynthesis